MSAGAGRAPFTIGQAKRIWQVAGVVLAILLAAIIVLFVIPTTSVPVTVVRSFGFVIGSQGVYFGKVNAYCSPPGVSTPGIVSFVWTATVGGNVTFRVIVPGYAPPPVGYATLYEVQNATQGGFSFVVGSLYPCDYPLNFAWIGSGTHVVEVSGNFIYNSTESTPLL